MTFGIDLGFTDGCTSGSSCWIDAEEAWICDPCCLLAERKQTYQNVACDIEQAVQEDEMVNSIVQQKGRIGLEAFVLILVLAIVSLAPAHAQEAGGTILGVVTDPSGGAGGSANVNIK